MLNGVRFLPAVGVNVFPVFDVGELLVLQQSS